MKAAFKYLIIFLLINIFVGLVTLLLGYLVCAIHFLVWRKCWVIPGTLLYHCYCVIWSFC